MAKKPPFLTAPQVRAELARRSLSIAWLAAKIDANYPTLCRKVRGEVDFSATEVVLIARALSIAPADLLPNRPLEVATA